MFAIPTPGRSVPIPGTRQLLPTAGQNIGGLTQYWQRRLRDGDVTLTEAAPIISPTTAPISATAGSTPASSVSEPTRSAS